MLDKNDDNFEPEIEFTDPSDESDRAGEDGDDDSATGKIKKLRQDLKESKEESQKNLDGWQRALADYANLQKNSGEQLKDLKGYVVEGFIEELLPVLDSFEMAMKNKASWESVSENWRKGVEYIYNQILKILENNGVEEIKDVKEKFNPEIHHIVEEIETEDESQDHQIAEIVQKGYKSKKTIIRPAQVKVFIKSH